MFLDFYKGNPRNHQFDFVMILLTGFVIIQELWLEKKRYLNDLYVCQTSKVDEHLDCFTMHFWNKQKD